MLDIPSNDSLAIKTAEHPNMKVKDAARISSTIALCSLASTPLEVGVDGARVKEYETPLPKAPELSHDETIKPDYGEKTDTVKELTTDEPQPKSVQSTAPILNKQIVLPSIIRQAPISYKTIRKGKAGKQSANKRLRHRGQYILPSSFLRLIRV